MNKFIITGRLCGDPQIRYTQTGKAMATFSFAVDRPFTSGDKKKTDFFSCTAFGSTAENMDRLHIGKGTKLLLEGEVFNDNYQDKNGVKHYSVNVNVRHFEFCEKKASNAPAPAEDENFIDVPKEVEDEFEAMFG